MIQKDLIIDCHHRCWLNSQVMCPSSLNDFCPISLLGMVHKLVAQVLAVGLWKVLGSFVQGSQMAFIRGRTIFYVWMVALEEVDKI